MMPTMPNFYQLRSALFLTASVAAHFYYSYHLSGICFKSTASTLLPSPFFNGFPEKREDDPFTTYPALLASETDENTLASLELYLKTYFPSLKPDLFSISEILSWASGKKSDKPTTDALKYYVLEGCDSAVTATFKALNNAIRQLASQFDLGESPFRGKTHPKDFGADNTQGPTERSTS